MVQKPQEEGRCIEGQEEGPLQLKWTSEEERIQNAESRPTSTQLSTKYCPTSIHRSLSSSSSQSHNVDISTDPKYSTAFIRCGLPNQRGSASPSDENCRRSGGTRRGTTTVSGTRRRMRSMCRNRGREGCGIGDKKSRQT